jgi:hypothetical protein
MKYIAAFIAGVLLAGGIFFFVMRHQTGRSGEASATRELIATREAVAKRLQETGIDIASRLAAFAQEVASDQLFSLRLLVENNASAPEVTGKAAQFMVPMGFSLLEIVDSSSTILSSGHFPASRGDRIQEKAMKMSTEPTVVEDAVMGQKTLTLQAKSAFTIADSIRFYVIGGVVVDEQFLAGLSPRENVKVLLRNGDAVMGMKDVRTISEVKDAAVIINDKKYPALQLPLPAAGFDRPLVLIVVMMK